MKSIKQLANEINIDKQRIYRHIKKNHFNDVHHDAGVMWCDEALEIQIKSHFIKNIHINESHHDVHQTKSLDAVIAILQNELEVKNEQIHELNARLAESNTALVAAQQSLQAAQLLHGGTMHKQLTDGNLDSDERPKKSFLKRIFSKSI